MHKKIQPRHRIAAAIFLTSLAGAAHAHAAFTGMGDFYSGMLHPLTSLEHVLFLFALGVLAGQRGVLKVESVLLIFPVAFAAGACLPLWLPPWPPVFYVNLASIVLAGGLIALGKPVPIIPLSGLALVFGLTHGYANGAEMTSQTKLLPFIGGLTTGAFLCFVYSMGMAEWIFRQKPAWLRIGVRAVGSWIAAIGILVLGIGHRALLQA